MVDPRSARLRLPSGAQAPAAPTSPPGLGSPPRAGWAPGAALAASRLSRGGRRAAIRPDLEPPPWPDLRSSSCASFSLAPSDLRRSVQSGPRFRGEGDSDGSAGRKIWSLENGYHPQQHLPSHPLHLPYLLWPHQFQQGAFSMGAASLSSTINPCGYTLDSLSLPSCSSLVSSSSVLRFFHSQ